MVTRKEGRKEGRWRWTESNRQSPEKKKQHERRHRSLKASQAIQASKRQPPRPARLSNGSGGVAASSVVHRMYAAQTAGAATAGIREYWRKEIERIANSRTPVARTSLSNISTRASSLHCERVPLTPMKGWRQTKIARASGSSPTSRLHAQLHLGTAAVRPTYCRSCPGLRAWMLPIHSALGGYVELLHTAPEPAMSTNCISGADE